jgi:tRNA (mo5U34)-methyltransferase
MEKFLEHIEKFKLRHCHAEFEALIHAKREFLNQAKGNLLKFRQVFEKIQDHVPSGVDLKNRVVTIGTPEDLSLEESKQLYQGLDQLCPWRKGPFEFFGIRIDSEWQSWMKWERLLPHIKNLKGRRIMDIGSSNGYYMFRAAAHAPLMIMGLEPQSYFYFQYLVIQKFLNQDNVFCLPIPHDEWPKTARYFDTVFCMGVLYHRPSPVEMLRSIHESMKKGGELVLENLVLETRQNRCLFPEDRYAKMRNVYFIPDLLAMESWLSRAGFKNIRCVDVTRTSPAEQRKTRWIQTESLKNFLDPQDPDKTVEGYPGPVRAIFLAEAG